MQQHSIPASQTAQSLQLGGMSAAAPLGIPQAPGSGMVPLAAGISPSSVGLSPGTIRVPVPIGLGGVRPATLGGAAGMGTLIGHTSLLGVSGRLSERNVQSNKYIENARN